MSILDLILIALAVWYLQQVLRWESGPFGWFDAVRLKVFGVRIDVTDTGVEALPVRPGTLADLVMCIYCFSFWVALLLLIVWWFWHPVVWPFALAGAAVLISRIGGSHGAR